MVKEIIMDKRKDGTTVGMRGVEGYYALNGGLVPPVRQINLYDVKTDEEARIRAGKDGLIQELMVEVYATELMPCVINKISLEDLLLKSK